MANTKQPNGRPWSESALSIASGVSRSLINQILTGRSSPEINIELVKGLAKVGRVSEHWVMTGKGPREPIDSFAPDEFTEALDFIRWKRQRESSPPTGDPTAAALAPMIAPKAPTIPSNDAVQVAPKKKPPRQQSGTHAKRPKPKTPTGSR